MADGGIYVPRIPMFYALDILCDEKKRQKWVVQPRFILLEVLFLLLPLGPGLRDGSLHLVVTLVVHLLHQLQYNIERAGLATNESTVSSRIWTNESALTDLHSWDQHWGRTCHPSWVPQLSSCCRRPPKKRENISKFWKIFPRFENYLLSIGDVAPVTARVVFGQEDQEVVRLHLVVAPLRVDLVAGLVDAEGESESLQSSH